MVDFAAHMGNIINRLGQPVTITPSGLPERVVNAVFSATPAEAFGMIGGFRPTLRVIDAGNDDLREGDAVRIGCRDFTITEISDDPDSGDRVLSLEAA